MNKYLIHNRLQFAGLIVFKAFYAAAFVGFALVLQYIVNLVTGPDSSIGKFLGAVGWAMLYVAVFVAMLLLKDKISTAYLNRGLLRLRNDLTDKLLEERYEEFAKNDTAKYLSHATNDINILSTSYFKALGTLPEEIFTFFFAVAAAFWINYVVALVMLGLTFLILIVPLVFNRPLNRANLRLSQAIKDYTAGLKQTFLGIEVVKSFQAVDEVKDEIHALGENLRAKTSFLDRLNLYASDIGLLIVVLLQLGSIAIAGYMFLKGKILLGSVIAVVQLSGNMYSPLIQVAEKIALVSGVRELSAVLLQLIRTPVESSKPLKPLDSAIELSHVSYRYKDAESTLTDISLTFKRGHKYLIVGKSGSGKSTLLKLIAKTYTGYSGSITFDGVDYRLISESALLDQIAYAQQQSFIFERSIRANIDFRRTGDEKLLEKAIAVAELDNFIAEQPAGLDTRIDEEVERISGGEKQRIGLARAIYKNRSVLLLDEITSSLDPLTAYKVENNILQLPDCTVLNVTHKPHPDLICRYDQICVIEEGHLAFCQRPEDFLAGGWLNLTTSE